MSNYFIWSKLQEDISFSQAQKIALNAYVTMIMVTLKQRHFEKTWSFLSNFKAFLESLSSSNTIQQGFDKVHQSEEKMVWLYTIYIYHYLKTIIGIFLPPSSLPFFPLNKRYESED